MLSSVLYEVIQYNVLFVLLKVISLIKQVFVALKF